MSDDGIFSAGFTADARIKGEHFYEADEKRWPIPGIEIRPGQVFLEADGTFSTYSHSRMGVDVRAKGSEDGYELATAQAKAFSSLAVPALYDLPYLVLERHPDRSGHQIVGVVRMQEGGLEVVPDTFIRFDD